MNINENILCNYVKDLLFVTDLDGTLLNSQGVLSDFSVGVINSAIDYGVKFTFATGKSYQTVEKEVSKLNIKIPCITYDGACINNKDGRIIEYNTVDTNSLNAIINSVYKTLTSFLVYCIIDGKERILWSKSKVNSYVKMYFINRKNDDRFLEVSSINEYYCGNILFIAFLDSLENVNKIKMKLVELGIKDIHINQDAYIKSMYWLKVKNINANKGYAIKKIKESLNSKYIVSFGNDTNDIDMFNVSDYNLCVCNSNDKIKKLSSSIIESNNDDGVARFIIRLLHLNNKM